MAYRLLILLLGTTLLVPLCAEQWTVLIHMAGDNNLWQNVIQDVNDMESVDLPANLNLIVQTDLPASSPYPGGSRWKIRRDNSPQITSPLIADLGVINSGDPQTLNAFFAWGFQRFPAERRMAVIWGHGDNWFKDQSFKWISPDYDAQSSLSVAEGDLRKVFAGLPGLDILVFDACSMQSLEVLAEVMDAADYVVASEERVPAAGFPYQSIIPLFASGSAEQIAAQITGKYLESYEAGGCQNPHGFTLPMTCSTIKTSALAAFYPAFRDYFFSGSLSSYTEMLGKREHYWEMNTAYNDVDVGEMLASYAGRGGGSDALAESWAACVVSSGSLNILHQVGSAAVWFPCTRQHFDAWWRHYAKLDFARYRWLTVLNRVYGQPDVAPPAPQVKGHEFILGTLALDLVQPDSPDSLWYELTIYEQNVAIQQRQLTPGYWQSGFRVCLPVQNSCQVSICSVDVWGNRSDSTWVDVAYPELPLELLITPNPVWDKAFASARWYLPEDAAGSVELCLYNLRGQKVLSRRFFQAEAGEGVWLLSAESGFRKLGRGVYIVKLHAGGQVRQRKFTIN